VITDALKWSNSYSRTNMWSLMHSSDLILIVGQTQLLHIRETFIKPTIMLPSFSPSVLELPHLFPFTE